MLYINYIVRKYKIYMYKVQGTFLACFVASVYTFDIYPQSICMLCLSRDVKKSKTNCQII